ncbi:hypothetical protein P4S72_11470 [Vibrio sp. PP-XX7]
MQQQGRFVFLLLFCILWMGAFPALGAELDIRQRDALLRAANPNQGAGTPAICFGRSA